MNLSEEEIFNANQAAERYVDIFSKCWKLKDPQLFLDQFCDSMSKDIRLEQPLIPTSIGHQAFRQEFYRLRTFIPDINGNVTSWSWNSMYLYIELTLSGTLGGRNVAWNLVDRLKLDKDNKCSERISYFDPLPLILYIILTPTCWIRLLRSGMLLAMIRSLKTKSLINLK